MGLLCLHYMKEFFIVSLIGEVYVEILLLTGNYYIYNVPLLIKSNFTHTLPQLLLNSLQLTLHINNNKKKKIMTTQH